MAGEYRTLSEGLVLVGTLLAWNIVVDWVGYVSPTMHRLLTPRAVILVKNGRVIQPNLRRQFITEQELQAKLRENGVEDLSAVKAAYMEADGDVSVLKR